MLLMCNPWARAVVKISRLNWIDFCKLDIPSVVYLVEGDVRMDS